MGDDGENIVGRRAAFLLNQTVGVFRDLPHVFGRDDRLVWVGDPHINPIDEPGAVLGRHAENDADRLQRQFAGNPQDEIDALSVADVVEDPAGDRAKFRFQPADRSRRETLGHQASDTAVFRIVHEVQDQPGRSVVVDARTAGPPVAALVGGEGLGIAKYLVHVVVAADDPEPLAVRRGLGRRMPIDRCIFAQPSQAGMGKPSPKGLAVRKIGERFHRRYFRVSPPSPPIWRRRRNAASRPPRPAGRAPASWSSVSSWAC